MSELKKELESLLNRHSAENGSNTPDFILANYLIKCLENFNNAVVQREAWYETSTAVPFPAEERGDL